jgi:hypothetical protein
MNQLSRFLTNASSPTPELKSKRLAGSGIAETSPLTFTTPLVLGIVTGWKLKTINV